MNIKKSQDWNFKIYVFRLEKFVYVLLQIITQQPPDISL
jgi:hypothetical protein